MAIPKYQREQLQAPTVTEKKGGESAQAEAQGYSNIAQAYGQKSQAYGQTQRIETGAAAQEINNLANKLSQFNQMLETTTRNVVSQVAQRQGVKDVAKRREEIIAIKKMYGSNPQKMQEEIDKVNTATMVDDFSLYGRIYGNSVNAAYTNQVEIDAANLAREAKYNANGNPELFKEMYNEYTGEFIKNAPNDMTAIASEKAFEKHHTSVYRDMYDSMNSQISKQQQTNTNGAIKGLQGLIESYSKDGDATRTKALQGQLSGLIMGEVNAGRMSDAEAQWVLRDSYVTAQSNEFMRFGSVAVNAGRGYSFLAKIQNENHEYGKAFQALEPEAQQKVLSQIESGIDAYEKAELGKYEHENKTVTVMQENNTNSLKEDLAGGASFTTVQLSNMVQNNEISEADMKEIQRIQDNATDPDTLLAYSDDKTLVDTSVDEIMNNGNLSIDDKRELLDRRDGAFKDPLYSWTKSVSGQEAMRRLKEDFDIPDTNIAVIMSKVKGDRTANEQDYIDLRRQMFDQVQDMKFSDQPEGAMKVYNKLMDNYGKKKEATKTEEANTALQNKYNNYAQKAEVENEGWFTSGVTAEEMMRRDVKNGSLTQGAMDNMMQFSKPQKVKPKKQEVTPPTEKPLTVYDRPGTPQYTKYTAKADAMGLPRVGGTRSWRNKSQGNLKYGDFAIRHGAIGKDSGGFAIFPTEQAGRDAQKNLLKSKNYRNLNLAQAIGRYSPSSDNNNVPSYVAAVGVTDPNKKLKDYSENEMEKLLDAMKKHEGWKEGRYS